MATDLAARWSDMAWTHAPAQASSDAHGQLKARSKNRTDFWQKTFYGFERDDGHALLTTRAGDFSASVCVQAKYNALYDQAGVMLRISATEWIKFGVEYTDGQTHLSVVVTSETSDWSARPITLSGMLSLRATRLKRAVLLEHRFANADWQMARLAPISDATIGVGPYLCSPERAGFEAEFSKFVVSDPQVLGLHEG